VVLLKHVVLVWQGGVGVVDRLHLVIARDFDSRLSREKQLVEGWICPFSCSRCAGPCIFNEQIKLSDS
jgi:hypothetical protein